MPFMLRTCGHALRFMTPDGICRRCSMDDGCCGAPEGEIIGGHHSPSLEMVLDKPNSPEVKSNENHRSHEVFMKLVEKLVAVLVNSDGPEVMDAVQHVAKALSTFSSSERSDFIYQLIITYCEARREDQPKIIVLIKELAKKNVLVRTHFLQSAKKILADSGALVIDWPNIYDCSMFLICACLKSVEDFRPLLTVLSKSPSDHVDKYLDSFRNYCHVTDLDYSEFHGKTRKSIVKETGTSLPGPSGKLPFFRSPEMVADRFIRPVSTEPPKPPGWVPKVRYSRDQLLEVERKVKGSPVPVNMLELGWVGERDKLPGKRPRYISESALPLDEGSKRILESTSPHLPLVMGNLPGDSANHGRPFFASPRTAEQHSPLKTGFDILRPEFARKLDFQRNTPVSSENVHPNTNSGYSRPNSGRSSNSVSETHGNGSGDASYRKPGPVKTKKFLTALSMEKDSDGEPSVTSPVTLGPSARLWTRGSGSLKPLAPEQRKNIDENWRRVVS